MSGRGGKGGKRGRRRGASMKGMVHPCLRLVVLRERVKVGREG